MGKRSSHNVLIRNTEHKLMRFDPWKPVILAQYALIGGALQLGDCFEVARVSRDRSQHWLIESCGDQAVGIVLLECYNRRRHPPRLASSILRIVAIAGTPPRIMYCSGVSPVKSGFVLRRVTQLAARGLE